MIWLYPPAAFALIALAAPLLVHILARRRATRQPFPTLRFIHPHRLASVRRRALQDAALLALRAAIVIAAAGAIAGPLLLTDARKRAWDGRTIRAEVRGQDIHEDLVRAAQWLSQQPPGRREIVVRGPMTIGAITDADIAAIPPRVGLRFERTGSLPGTRTLRTTAVVENSKIIERDVTLTADRTSVRDVGVAGGTETIVDIAGRPEQQPAVDRLRMVVATERLPAPLPNRRARVTFGVAMTPSPQPSTAWAADAAARIVRAINGAALSRGDVEVQFGSDGNRLLVWTTMAPTDRRAADIVRSVARGLAPPADRAADEIVPIPEAQLRAWSREPAPAGSPTNAMIDRDDRRWLWAAVLLLIALEWWMRRGRRTMTEDSVKDRAHAA